MTKTKEVTVYECNLCGTESDTISVEMIGFNKKSRSRSYSLSGTDFHLCNYCIREIQKLPKVQRTDTGVI